MMISRPLANRPGAPSARRWRVEGSARKWSPERIRIGRASCALRRQAAGPLRGLHCHARALWHQFIGIALVVHRAGSGAGGAGPGITVVLPFQGHAVAFLELAGPHPVHRLLLLLLLHF